MDFGQALTALKSGLKLAREGWDVRGMYVVLRHVYHTPVYSSFDDSPNFQSCLMIRTSSGDMVPWTASQTDILCDDWMIV